MKKVFSALLLSLVLFNPSSVATEGSGVGIDFEKVVVKKDKEKEKEIKNVLISSLVLFILILMVVRFF